MNLINYKLLGEFSDFYGQKDYDRIEVPWWVTEEIINITKPIGANSYKLDRNNKCLLASGEQSFLYLMNKGQLVDQRYYQTITPCFREEAFDPFHSKYFMKLELICVNPIFYEKALTKILNDAFDCFSLYIDRSLLQIVETDQSQKDPTIVPDTKTYDIVVNLHGREIEIGSYGVRHCDIGTWVYGTGIAEPRFSKLRKIV